MEKAIFWDFDGTLVLPGSKWSFAVHQAALATGYNLPLDAVRSHLKTGFSWHSPETEYTDATGDAWWEKLFEHFDALYVYYNIPAQRRAGINAAVRKKLLRPQTHILRPGTLPALRVCQRMGFRQYLLSNNFPELWQVAVGLEINEYFAGCTVSGMVGYEKPRREIFEIARRQAGNPKECWMVGDNYAADIEGGKAAGMKTIWLAGDGPGPAADFVCGGVGDVPRCFS